MNSWLADQEAQNITVVPDGNGEFTEQMGLLVDKSAIGFGMRSWRYSMLVNNGIIEMMFIEPDLPGDPFEVSEADTMFSYLDPEAKAPQEVSIFTKPNCPFSIKAKAELSAAGYEYEEIVLGKDASLTSLKAITGRDTVPQIFIGGEFIGASEALSVYL
jgi:glutaredoxin-like protein